MPDSSQPIWIDVDTVYKLHEAMIEAYGGSAGVREPGLLESAIAAPLNRFAYEGEVDPAKLAASYVFALTKNHAFVDGNKRTALATGVHFLDANGYALSVDLPRIVQAIEQVASGELSQDRFETFMGEYTVEIQPVLETVLKLSDVSNRLSQRDRDGDDSVGSMRSKGLVVEQEGPNLGPNAVVSRELIRAERQHRDLGTEASAFRLVVAYDNAKQHVLDGGNLGSQAKPVYLGLMNQLGALRVQARAHEQQTGIQQDHSRASVEGMEY